MTYGTLSAGRKALSAIFLVSTVLSAGAQMQAESPTPPSSASSQGYATDKFDGFEPVDRDDSVPQKDKSFWYSVKAPTPDAQLAYAMKAEAAGQQRRTRKAYEALIREWPTAPQALTAQKNLAHFYEANGKYEKAFDEYQYLLTYFAGNCPYDDVLDHQFRIANDLLHNNRSMFGWLLSGTDKIRGRFEQIVRNAPRSALAPEVMLIIGSIRVSEKEYDEAVKVYDGLLNRFPKSPQATPAVFLAAECRYTLAVKHSYNEHRCREAIGFFKAVLGRIPNHPQKEQLVAWQSELTALLVEQNYLQTLFYDTTQRKSAAAKAAYQRFLFEFPDSKHAPQVRNRLAELEKIVPAPAK